MDVVVIGGAGHIGLPLALSLAKSGKRVAILDKDVAKLKMIRNGIAPFLEGGINGLLNDRKTKSNLTVTSDNKVILRSKFVIVTIGTPIDEHMSPVFGLMKKMFFGIREYLIDGQIIILRSTLYPGVTVKINSLLKSFNKKLEVCYCPERIAEGKAIEEIQELPQIVSGFSPMAIKKVRELFSLVSPEIVEVEPIEAELSKLFSNAWRYIKFAVANQFYMIAEDSGADYSRVYRSMVYKYPRNADLAKPGFSAGPCLFKDTMQLAAFVSDGFHLGRLAMSINEGMPMFLVNRLKSKYDLSKLTVGILGMAFKPNSDDKRDSLAYKLKSILEFEANKVVCSDVYIKDADFVEANRLIRDSDIIVVGCPHREYERLKYRRKMVINMWL